MAVNTADLSRRASEPMMLMLLLAILLLAAYLRMGQAGISEFKADEANLSLLALDMAHGRSLPLLGIGSSTGFPNAPLNVYVLALPYSVDSSPVLATQFIGLLNVLAVALVYGVARRHVGPVPALIAALLLAVSPWSVVFSRKIWAQNMLPLFVMLVLAAGFAGLLQGRRWGQLAFAPLVVLTGQIHYGAFVIVPSVLFLVAAGRRRLTRAFWGGGVIGLVLIAPFITGLAQAGLLSPSALAVSLAADESDALTPEADAAIISDEALHGAAIMIAGTEIHALAGPQRFRDYLDALPDAYPLFNPLAGLVLASALWLAYRSLRLPDARSPVDVALLLLLVFPVGVFSLRWTPFYIHYLIPMLPAAFLVFAFALQDLWRLMRSRPRLRIIAAAGFGGYLAAIAVLQVVFSLSLLDFVDNNATPGGFGTPLNALMPVREALLAEDPAQVLALLAGESVNFAGEDRVWEALLYDVPQIRFEDVDVTVYPVEPVTMLVAGCTASQDLVFRLRPGEGCYHIRERAPDDLDTERFQPVMPPNRFASGVVVEGFDWEDSSGCLALLWRIDAVNEQDVQFAVHGFGATGERVAQRDGLSWPGRYWQAGDRLVRHFCFGEQGADLTRIDIGMYTLTPDNGFRNFDLLNDGGAPVGQMLRLPLPSSGR